MERHREELDALWPFPSRFLVTLTPRGNGAMGGNIGPTFFQRVLRARVQLGLEICTPGFQRSWGEAGYHEEILATR